MKSFILFLIRLVVNSVSKVDIQGIEVLHALGERTIFVSNHLGKLDVFLIYYILRDRNLIVMVAEKYQESPLYRFVGKYLNIIFIDRHNADVRSFRNILRQLKGGGILVMAPEGTRSSTGSLQEGKPGAAYLASKLGVPIIPVGMTGTADQKVVNGIKRLHRTRVHVFAGQPFTLPELPRKDRDVALQNATDEIMCRIAALLPEPYRGVYADHPRLHELEQQ
jgi:1-acyl-sn-glycerol-3-phosphate acyltransferase